MFALPILDDVAASWASCLRVWHVVIKEAHMSLCEGMRRNCEDLREPQGRWRRFVFIHGCFHAYAPSEGQSALTNWLWVGVAMSIDEEYFGRHRLGQALGGELPNERGMNLNAVFKQLDGQR